MPGQNRQSYQKAVANSQLPPLARLVAHTVALLSDPTGGQGVWVEVDDLARLTGIKAAGTVKKQLRALVEGGWLRSLDCVWHLTFPGEIGLTGRMTEQYPATTGDRPAGAARRLINPPL